MDLLSELERNGDLREKITTLKHIFLNKEVIVAFSGGRDSALLAYLALNYAKKVIAVFVQSSLSPSLEFQQAQEFCQEYHITLEVMTLDTLSIKMIQDNSLQRCYYCKQLILQNLEEMAERTNFNLVVDGTNYTDLRLPRPGLQALKESKVVSPFALAQVTKSDIIVLSRHLDLISKDYTSQACLASRIAFDVPLSEELLHKIDMAEQFLRDTCEITHEPLRVRVQQLHPRLHLLARIEGGEKLFQLLTDHHLRQVLIKHFHELGFTYVTVDLEGFQSGSMHKVLENHD